MQLIGYMDSPFVRRVAITMRFLGIDFDHRELSIFRDYDEFRGINPLVKVPTLVCDDGEILVDSSLIIDYLESRVPGRSLMPEAGRDYRSALRFIGIALLEMEKVVQTVYETTQRPEDKQHGPWLERVQQQREGALGMLEESAAKANVSADRWLLGKEITQADITVAVAWRFTQHIDRARVEASDFPALAGLSDRAEALPQFLACPLSG